MNIKTDRPAPKSGLKTLAGLIPFLAPYRRQFIYAAIALVVAAWLWSSAQFPTWAQPVMLHPACRAFVSALGVLDIWAACDWLAERMLDPERK